MLLLHGASRLSLDGFGSIEIPPWVKSDDKLSMYNDLCVLAAAATEYRNLTAAELFKFEARFQLPILGGIAVVVGEVALLVVSVVVSAKNNA